MSWPVGDFVSLRQLMGAALGLAFLGAARHIQGAMSVALNKSVHDAIAMAVQVTDESGSSIVGGKPCRVERVALLLIDGSVWQVEGVFVALGAPSMSLRAAAWSLKQERIGRRHGLWRMVHPPRQAVAVA